MTLQPDRMSVTDCAYCGCRVEAHDPVVVVEGDPEASSAGTERSESTAASDESSTAAFCNYGCLLAHVEAEGLATDAACNWSPSNG